MNILTDNKMPGKITHVIQTRKDSSHQWEKLVELDRFDIACKVANQFATFKSVRMFRKEIKEIHVDDWINN